MRKAIHVGKKSITLLAAALLAGFVPIGVLPAPGYAQTDGGTVVIAGNTTLVGTAVVNGTIMIEQSMALADHSELAAGSFIAAGSVPPVSRAR